jgi:hypothetical protein
MSLSRVRKKSVLDEIAGVERQVSPRGLLEVTVNVEATGMTKTLPNSLVK